MLGVDRLDMIKGIPQKLLAFEKFLDEHPEWADQVLLIQIAVPSRVEVPEYQVRLQHQPALPRLASCSGQQQQQQQWCLRRANALHTGAAVRCRSPDLHTCLMPLRVLSAGCPGD